MYLLDTNAFIEANRLYYSFDIAPGFWAWLSDSSLNNKVGSIKAVKNEISAGEGELVEWAKKLPSSFWVSDTEDVVTAMAKLAIWAESPERKYQQEAIDEFMDSADLKLIAQAIACGATVVTREQSAPESKKRIKIPDICKYFNVPCKDPFSTYQKLGLRLVT